MFILRGCFNTLWRKFFTVLASDHVHSQTESYIILPTTAIHICYTIILHSGKSGKTDFKNSNRGIKYE